MSAIGVFLRRSVQFLAWICVAVIISDYGRSTPMEDKLETEIDLREPRSFIEGRHDLLSVRVDGFHSINVGFPDHVETHPINNWELFAMRYWYETRTPNSSCPMVPNGISAESDWALMVPCMFGDPEKPPRIIFVHNHMLSHFVESPLRFMNTSYRFVLVTGGTDMTVPRQIDQRYRQAFRGFGGNDGGGFFRALVDSPMLIHWFAENRDVLHPKLSSLPTAMSVGGNNPDAAMTNLPDPATILPVTERPMKVFSSDRIRSGTGQWALRAEVKQLCLSVSDICMTPPDAGGEGISRNDYLELLVSVPFVACVKGGGIDPSPKAWESVLAGTIPIILTSWLDDAYLQLPIVILQDWHTVFNASRPTEETQQILLAWATALAPYYEFGSAKRNATLERLRTKYWMDVIQHKVDEYDASVGAPTQRYLRNHKHPREYHDSLPEQLAIVVPGMPQQQSISDKHSKNLQNAFSEEENLRNRLLSDGFFTPNHHPEGKSSHYSKPVNTNISNDAEKMKMKRLLESQSQDALLQQRHAMEMGMYEDVLAATKKEMPQAINTKKIAINSSA